MNIEIAALSQRADELARSHDWGPTAEALNRRLVELAPRETAPHNRLARCLLERGDLEAARTLYRRVVELDPANAVAHKNLRRIADQIGSDEDGERTVLGTSSAQSRALGFLHNQLRDHFAELSRERAKLGGAPIFALEHGLPADQLALLEGEVHTAVRTGDLSVQQWLPFVVYAAEIGYEYSGDEYWQTFEARTPMWAEKGDRHYIRDRFIQFAATYRGAQPAGPWAAHFSIICWPITHAVLPTDLQRNLARLLFDYRSALTSELLGDPPELGRRLAARAVHTSSRFQNFAQNTGLLGQVAAALLLGEDAGSPYLLSATLQRIVSDLSNEREAWRQLRGARASADQVRTRGIHHGGRQPDDPATRDPSPPRTADPTVSLREEDGGWTAYLHVPDLTALAERLPDVHDEAGRLRALVAGHEGPPLASGQLLFPGRSLRLARWPPSEAPLIQLERGSAAVNSLLADQCVLTVGPVWVFRIRGDGTADEVRSKTVRPGNDYVLLSREPLSSPPDWIRSVSPGTADVCAYAASLPALVSATHIEALSDLNLRAVADVRIRPTAVAPASWDGEGSAEWVAGDSPILGISSSRAISTCLLTLDGNVSLIEWPTSQPELLLRFADLEVGPHQLALSLLEATGARPVAEGQFSLVMRSPPVRLSSGTYAEGLMMLPSPVRPTLTELWDGKGSVQVLGPAGAVVELEFALEDNARRVVVHRRLEAATPISGPQWADAVLGLRQDEEVLQVYDATEAITVRVSNPQLGVVTLRCERDFSPLRWVAGRDGAGPYVRLLDNSEGAVAIHIQEFAAPDLQLDGTLDEGSQLRWSSGGLVTAESATSRSSMILPPHIRRPSDIRLLEVRSITASERSVAEVRRLIELADRWSTASLPANPFASTGRTRVLQALASRIGALMGGGRWAVVESRFDDLAFSTIEPAMGNQPSHRALARAVLRESEGLVNLSPMSKAGRFGRIIDTYVPTVASNHRQMTLAEVALRLASDPASLLAIPSADLERDLEDLFASPFVVRAARFVVLETHDLEERDSGSPYRGWLWA